MIRLISKVYRYSTNSVTFAMCGAWFFETEKREMIYFGDKQDLAHKLH